MPCLFLSAINGHLDSGCATDIPTAAELAQVSELQAEREARRAAAAALSFLKTPLPGLLLIENFITKAEEQELVAQLDGEQWEVENFNGPKLHQHYGAGMSYKHRIVTLSGHKEIPPFLEPVFLKMRERVPILNDFFPNQVGVNAYLRQDGHHIRPTSTTARFLGQTSPSTFSLTAEKENPKALTVPDAVYDVDDDERGPGETEETSLRLFTCEEPGRIDVLLPRRSLQIMTGDSRY